MKESNTYIPKGSPIKLPDIPLYEEDTNARISHSQFEMYQKCPHRWYMRYVKKEIRESPTIHLVFGTAMHEVLQEYLRVFYTKTIAKADALDLDGMLRDSMLRAYEAELESNNGEHFSTREEYYEVFNDGLAILHDFKKNRSRYFMKKGYELVGIEVPIYLDAIEGSPVKAYGFLDVVVRDTVLNKYIIYDIKTSTKGWSKYAKADTIKVSQLVLYKYYFAQLYNVDVNSIEIRYFIVKRKVNDDAEYANQRRHIQQHLPASGTVTRNMLKRNMTNFIGHAFIDGGTHNTDTSYQAISSSYCRFCPLNDDEDRCPPQSRLELT